MKQLALCGDDDKKVPVTQRSRRASVRLVELISHEWHTDLLRDSLGTREGQGGTLTQHGYSIRYCSGRELWMSLV
jgi:hypothetical protein